MAVNTLQQLNVKSLPPGTSQAFQDWLLRLGLFSQGTGDTANEANGTANDAFVVADQQRVRNDQQDGQISSLNGRVNTLELGLSTLEDTVEALDAAAVKKDVATLQVMSGPLSIGTEIRVNNIKVMGGRNTGWTQATGAQKKGNFNADQSYADVGGLNGGLMEIRQVVAALIAMGFSQGFIGT